MAARSHGMSNHPLYGVWKAMRQRCLHEKHPQYHRYGGRGIKVCDEWIDDPRPFIEWGMANGYASGLEIDREKNDQGYSPGNCRFVDDKTQASNRRLPTYTPEGKAALVASITASNIRRGQRYED